MNHSQKPRKVSLRESSYKNENSVLKFILSSFSYLIHFILFYWTLSHYYHNIFLFIFYYYFFIYFLLHFILFYAFYL